jgi:hypothetical protein
VRLFQTSSDDLVAGCDLTRPCKDQANFALKIQALSGMIDRLNSKELLSLIKNKQGLREGSINILERFLMEQYGEIPRHIIGNLRTLITLRNKMYPAHSTATELLLVLRNIGINEFPLKDWEAGFTKILSLVTNSLVDLNAIIQTGGKNV